MRSTTNRWGVGTRTAGAARAAAVAAVLCGCLAGGVRSSEAADAKRDAAVEPKRDVAVTVYNENLGVVKDRRAFSVAKGVSDVSFTDVAALIDPTSVHLRPLGAASLEVLWQDYRFDLVSTEKLLERYVDQSVQVATKDDQVREGTLLSYDGGSLVLRDAKGGLALVNRAEVRQVSLASLPKGLITRPTLVWRLRAAQGGDTPAEVSYMTAGMSWHAEYVAVLSNEAATSLDLQGWASVDNRSGATFDDAKIKLVAGSVNRAPTPRPYAMDYAREMAVKAAGTGMAERGFFEYHLYEVPLRATLSNNEVKQLGLLHADGVKSVKKFAYDAEKDAEKVMVTVEFENATASGLGMPLPEGVVRVFQRDTDGSLELAGEDRIKHTPKNETVRVAVGAAFDVTPERKQTETRQISARVQELSYEITLKNHKSQTVDVTVVEHAYGDWEIIKSTMPAKKKDATTFEFAASAKPETPLTIAYTVRIRS